jgi:HAD superfamily hydrolase (TIGR01509 family)
MQLKNLHSKKCFLFDLDGTLIDSSSCHELAFIETIERNCPALINNFSYDRFKGQRTDDVFRELGADEEDLSKLTQDKQSRYRQKVQSGLVELMPSAQILLAFLERKKKRIFLVTSASKQSTEAVIKLHRIEQFFEHVITGDDVRLAKPAADAYLTCIAKAKIPLETAVAIEDAPSGIESAKSAGLDVVAVNNPKLLGSSEYVGSLLMLYESLVSTEFV